MRRVLLLTFAAIVCLTLAAAADTVILRDGTNYSGRFTGAPVINFADKQGIKYQFPAHDVQSLVFTRSFDTVILRNGDAHSGHFAGSKLISFEDGQGVKYQFPLNDVASMAFSDSRAVSGVEHPRARGTSMAGEVIPYDTPIAVRTDEAVDSARSYQGQLYSAMIADDVMDSTGAVGIPRGSPAKLIIRSISTGGAVHSAELTLDLYSVSIKGRPYQVVSSNVEESSKKGFGANRRTAEMTGGSTALGALVGALFGGGKGAGLGALAGAGGGFAAQVLTRGKEVRVPAETTLHFRLERTLVLRPA